MDRLKPIHQPDTVVASLLRTRVSKPEGTVATAHKLARILYAMITQTKACDPEKASKLTPVTQAKLLKHLQTRAATLGLQLVEIQTTS